MSNKIRVIVIDVNTSETIADTTMPHAPRHSDVIKIATPLGTWAFYEVQQVVWSVGALSSCLYLGVEPLPGHLDIGEQPAGDES